MQTDAIEITNGGPIEGTFKIDLSTGPGAYEFRGRRGTGKTTCISSIDWLTGHRVDVTMHDGAVSGKVEGFGVVAPIGGRKRRKGELAADTIDAEKFSLTDILDPQGKTPEVRDATRIKAIASLSDVQADPSLYYDLAGGQKAFDALGIAPSDDPVQLATRIKQAYERLAREKANTAEAESKHAEPLEHVPDGVDLKGESDIERLSEIRDEARDEVAALTDSRRHGLAKDEAIAMASERLEMLRSNYAGPTAAEAGENCARAGEAVRTARATVDDLQRKLNEAEHSLVLSQEQAAAAEQVREAADAHDAALTELEAATKSPAKSYPTEDEIEEARQSVEKATVAYEHGVRLRDVRRNLSRAKSHRETEAKARAAADEYRNKAAEVFDRLAKSMQTKHLQIRSVDGNPRLFVRHPRRGRTAFDQVNGLSDGERVDFTLRELLPHIEAPGLLPIPQRVWQDLQPSDRVDLHKLAVSKQLYLFGAQVDDGELRVAFLGGNDDERISDD